MSEEVVSIAITVLLTFFEALCLSLIYDAVLTKRVPGKWYTSSIIFSIVASVLFYALYFVVNVGIEIAGADKLPYLATMLMNPLLFIIVTLVLSVPFYKGSNIPRFVAPIVFCVLPYAIDNVLLAILSNIWHVDYQGIIRGSTTQFLLSSSISHLLLFLICLMINKLWTARKVDNPLSIREWIILVYPPLVTIITVLAIAQSDTTAVPSGLLIVATIGLLFLSFVILYLFNAVIKNEEETRNKVLLQSQNEQLVENARSLARVYDGQRTIVHDSVNNMQVVHQLLGEGKIHAAQDYLGKIIDKDQPFVSHSYTGNALADAVINQKISRAMEQNIKIEMHSERFDNIPIPDEDITTILYNLLDNAIEATSKVVENRVIKVKLQKSSAEFIISVVNPYIGPLRVMDDQRIATTKTDKAVHGYGLVNVASLLAKYGSKYMIFTDNGVFQITAIINHSQKS